MSDTNQKGDIGEAAFVLAATIKRYWTAKMPQDCPYDYILDRKDGKILRVQIKYRTLPESGSIKIKLVQNSFSNRQNYTANNIDAIGIFVMEMNKVFLVPVEDVVDVNELTMRCVPSRNNQKKKVRMIEQYEQW